MPELPGIDLKGSICAVTHLILSSNIFCCIVQIRVIGNRVERFEIDKSLEELVDGLSTFLCPY